MKKLFAALLVVGLLSGCGIGDTNTTYDRNQIGRQGQTSVGKIIAMTQVDIYTRRTPDYILSCAQDFRKGRMGYQQHPWTASLGGKAVVFTTNPASLEYNNRPNRWAGNLTLPRAVQHENVLLCLYRVEADFVDYLYSHLYFPKHEMDETLEKDGWIFGRKGNAYIAVRSLTPGYWEDADPELFRSLYGKNWQSAFDRVTKYEYISQGHAGVWVVEMGSLSENGSFESFKSLVDELKNQFSIMNDVFAKIDNNNKLIEEAEKIKNSDKLTDKEKQKKLDKIGKKIEDGSGSPISKAIDKAGDIAGVAGGAIAGKVVGGDAVAGGVGAGVGEAINGAFNKISDFFD